LAQAGRKLSPDEQPLQRAAHAGELVTAFEGELIRPDGSSIAVMITATPLFEESGKVRGAIAAIIDISDRKRADAQQQVLLHELQHRVKNIITTIGALASRMLKGERSVADFTGAFTARLAGMAKTHELLNQNNWVGTGLRPLVESAVGSYVSGDGKNFAIGGPELTLTASAAATLGMVLYELSTNAAKYGSWSERGGRVTVSWHIKLDGGEDNVSFSWIETGGSEISGPFEEGFGTGFMRRAVEYELDGKLQLEPSSTGLRCLIEFPLRRALHGHMTQQGDSRHAQGPR
jgi:two-component system CheB/CheR fusion protein